MKRVVFAVVVLGAVGLIPSISQAFTLTHTFCLAGSNPATESPTCPTGLGATLTVTDTGLVGGEDNDYWVYLTLDSRASGGFNTAQYTSIDAVQFDTPFKGDAAAPWGEYDAVPTVDSSQVTGGLTWTAYFGQINDCASNHNNDKSVCAGALGVTDTGNIDIWKFYIDLDDSFVNPFTASTDLNLRASFLGPNGGTNLSPSSQNIPDTGTGGTTGAEVTSGGTAVPEPASLMLLGTGLALAATRLRRRK